MVIAIIAILAGLLLPALTAAREKGWAAACLSNEKQIAYGFTMYSGDNGDYFPLVVPWWSPASYRNSLNLPCGGEWKLPSGSPNTIAPMLVPNYVPNDLVWVCPKRKRGLSYMVNGSVQSGQDPSITGFLSYGFNEIALFGGYDPGSGLMTGNVQPFKSSQLADAADTVAVSDVSGDINPSDVGVGAGDGYADAAWLDTVWAANSGINQSITSFNRRLQTAYAKHNNRLNFIYADCHAAPSYPSQLTWGQFYGVFQPNVTLKAYQGATQISSDPISRPSYDPLQWSTTPE